jgi:hypothetical protein
MGRESSKESNEPNPFLPFNSLCTSSSLSLSSGVPIDDELSGEPPVKNFGGPEIRNAVGKSSPVWSGTLIVKVGPTKTSIFNQKKENKKIK